MSSEQVDMASASRGGQAGDRAADLRGVASWTDRIVEARAWDRQHEGEWARVDERLRGIASRRSALDAEEAHLLRYADELKLWRAFGFGSLLEYMERAMGYAPHTAAERLRVARALAELPLLADALESGELAHSAVRELSRIAVPETEAVWLEAVGGKCLREIEAMVSGHKPGDLPTDETEPRLHRKKITLEVSPETYDIWRLLHALAAEEHGQRLSDDELIPSLFRRAYGGGGNADIHSGGSAGAGGGNSGTSSGSGGAGGSAGTGGGDAGTDGSSAGTGGSSAGTGGGGTGSGSASSGFGPGDGVGPGSTNAGDGGDDASDGRCGGLGLAGGPSYKIALKQCPDCNRAWQFSGGRDIEVDPAVLECAACDAVHLGSLDAATPERTTTTVTPRKREQVLARDGYCCTVPGCRRNVGLDLHHIEYQSRGGGHELSNLLAICDLHHRAVHFEKLVIRGVAPERVTFEFRMPRDRRNVIDDAPAEPDRLTSSGAHARSCRSGASGDDPGGGGASSGPTWTEAVA